MQRHRHQEFIRFLNRIEREVPADKAIHVILDNYAAHKKDKVRAWLARHPRFTFHFTPTSCSWLNAVEGFFAKLTRRRLKHGVFHSVVDLQAAINRFVRQYNADDPRPFIWKADPDAIIAARNRGFQTCPRQRLDYGVVDARPRRPLSPVRRHHQLPPAALPKLVCGPSPSARLPIPTRACPRSPPVARCLPHEARKSSPQASWSSASRKSC